MNKKYFNITEIAKMLSLQDLKKKKITPSTIRFWEKKFPVVRPDKTINKRKYYSLKKIELLKLIKHMLKNKHLSIQELQKIIKKNDIKLDEKMTLSVNTRYLKEYYLDKTINLKGKIKKLKDKNGKKNTY